MIHQFSPGGQMPLDASRDGESRSSVSERIGGLTAIVAIAGGAMSGAVMGLLAAGAVTPALVAFVSAAAGLALGWQAHRFANAH